jgi:hypothetical protein
MLLFSCFLPLANDERKREATRKIDNKHLLIFIRPAKSDTSPQHMLLLLLLLLLLMLMLLLLLMLMLLMAKAVKLLWSGRACPFLLLRLVSAAIQ